MSQEEIERLMGGMNQSTPEPAPAPAPAASSGGTMSQEEIERLMGGMNQSAPEPAPQSAPAPAPAPQPAPAPAPQPAPQQAAYPPYPGQPGAPAYPVPPYGQPYPYYPGYYPAPAPQAPAAQPAPKMIRASQAEMPRFADGTPLEEQQAENLDLLMSVPLEVSVEIGRARRKVQDVLAFTKGSLVMLNKLAGDQVDLYVNGQCIAKGDVVVVDDNFGIRITEVLKSPDPNELVNG